MQPKYSQAAFDAFATQQGLDEEYRQKLAALMGVQQPPMAADAGAMVGGMDPYAPPPMDMYAQTPPANYTPAAGFSEVVSDAPQGLIERAPEPPRADAALWKTDPKAYIEQENARRAASTQEPNLLERAGAAIKGLRNTPENYKPAPPKEGGGVAEEPSIDPALAESAALSASTPKANDHPGLEFYRPGAGGGGISSGMRMNLEGLQNEMAQANDNVRKSYMGVGDAQAATLDPAVIANQNIAVLDMERADRLQEQADRQEAYNKAFEQKAKEIDRFTKEQQDKLMGMDPLDPKRAWTQADFGGKLAILGSYIGAAFAMNYGNDPRAAERATEAIFGKDLEKQKMEYEKQRGNVDIGKNRYAALMSQYNDDQAATAAYYQPIYKALDAKIDAEIAKSKGGEAAANQQVIKAQIGQKLATIDATTTQGKLGAAQAMAMRAMSGPGGVQQNAPIPITKEVEMEQAALEKKLVKSPAGVFKFNGNEELAKKYNEELMGSSRMISGIDAALAAARNTNALGGAAGFYKSQAWKSLDSNIAQLVAEYGKSKGLGALDKGTVDLFKQIVGDPSRNVADVAKLLADFRARSISNISSSLKGIVLQPVYTLPAYNPRTGARTTIFQEGPVQNQQMGGLNLQGATPVQGPR